MRAIFGLVGILICIGVIVWLLSAVILPYDKTVIKQGQIAHDQAARIAGVDSNGKRAMDSVTLEPQLSNGRLDSILVTDIVAGGAFQKYYGLQRNDSIVEVGGQRVRDNTDGELVKALVQEAPQRNWSLVVIRDGERQTLSPEQLAAAPGAATQPAAQPARPRAESIQDQINALKIPTH